MNDRRNTGALDSEFAALRASMKRSFLDSWFLLGGWLGGTDTYKRTMGEGDEKFALERAAYTLTFRKTLPGVSEQLIMAGHEVMLAQWFRKPLQRRKIELYLKWYKERSAVKSVPEKLWRRILDSQQGEKIRLPIDVWGFPGGQTFLKGVPALSLEGIGGALSYPEPDLCHYFGPVIFATKARQMREATERDAEFGLRAAMHRNLNLVLLLARYVGSGGKAKLSSNDMAEFLYPELFQSIGTIGHEMMSCHQSFDKTLAAAEREAMEQFVTAMGFASLLCDLVDALTIGKENALAVIAAHPELAKVGIRVDSGDIARQCAELYEEMVKRGINPRTIVFEDEVSPEKIKEVYQFFREKTGQEPSMLFPGAGGWWWRDVHRDTVSAAYKRSATGNNPNVKFSNSPGKESLGGYLRVYGSGDTMIIADAKEGILGEPLYVKLVDQGRIVYKESFQTQAARSELTWGKYKRVKLSPLVESYQTRFNAMRDAEIAEFHARNS